MVRDLPGHMVIKSREKKIFSPEDLRQKLEAIVPASASLNDAEEFEDLDADDSEDGSISDDEAKEDLQESLLKELARMKREKAEEEARKLATARTELGNQLTTYSDYSLKLTWTEEAVFHNQAAHEPVRNPNEFVNDSVRNDGHRQFLQRYLRT
jgi:protein CWC15